MLQSLKNKAPVHLLRTTADTFQRHRLLQLFASNWYQKGQPRRGHRRRSGSGPAGTSVARRAQPTPVEPAGGSREREPLARDAARELRQLSTAAGRKCGLQSPIRNVRDIHSTGSAASCQIPPPTYKQIQRKLNATGERDTELRSLPLPGTASLPRPGAHPPASMGGRGHAARLRTRPPRRSAPLGGQRPPRCFPGRSPERRPRRHRLHDAFRPHRPSRGRFRPRLLRAATPLPARHGAGGRRRGAGRKGTNSRDRPGRPRRRRGADGEGLPSRRTPAPSRAARLRRPLRAREDGGGVRVRMELPVSASSP